MKFELLLTDQCFFLVLGISLVMLVRSTRREPTKQALKHLFKKPIAVISGIILLFFLVIGMLDSVRYQTAEDHESLSLLDRILFPLGSGDEQTYSAPFALNLYTANTEIIEGKSKQVYARLHYPPVQLQTVKDIQRLLCRVLGASFLISLLCVTCLWGSWTFLKRKKEPMTYPNAAGACALGTVFFCFLFLIASYWLSRDLHILGTGKIGEDIFYYTVKSIHTALIIGILTTLFMMPLALMLGLAAGYFGGWIDDIIQYVYTTLSSIPGVLLITASVLSMQTYIANHPLQFSTLAKIADARLLSLCLILGVTSWTTLCRLLRAEALKLREIDFILAAKTLSTKPLKILTKHLLPNVLHIVLITLILDFSFLVLAEAVLSYIGVGVSPMTISWGNMINAARLELARDPIVWWPVMAAFMLMFLLVLASNLFADAVREALDPK